MAKGTLILLALFQYCVIKVATLCVLEESFDNAEKFSSTKSLYQEDSSEYLLIVSSGQYGTKPYTDLSGSVPPGTYLAGQDTGTEEIVIAWSDINICGLDSLSFSGDFAEFLDDTGDIDYNDYIRISYSIDSQPYENLLWFSSTKSNENYNGFFAQDSDFSGQGEGAKLNNSFQTFTESIPIPVSGGWSLSLRLSVKVNANDEDFAMDNFKICGQKIFALDESFDTNAGFTTSINFFQDGSDYFNLHPSSGAGEKTYGNNPVGNKYLAGQDMDGSPEGNRTVTVTWSGIDISHLCSLEFSGDFAENDDGGHIDAGDSRYVDTLKIQAKIDLGDFTDVLWFNSNKSNGYFSVDSDFDGIGDGEVLGSDFKNFKAEISGTGQSLTLKFIASVNAGDEDFAIDNFRIYNTDGAENIDCQIQWSEWSSCNRTCGSGAQTRTAQIIQEAKGTGNPCPTGPSTIETVACNTNACPAPLTICAFNIQVLGVTKMSNPDVVQILVDIIKQFDIILIQEIRDISQTAIIDLFDATNSDLGSPTTFNMTIGQRQGRTSQKEQYAYIYRQAKVSLVEAHDFNDTASLGNDVFERDPYVARFNVPGAAVEDFFLVGVHAKPTDAVPEIDALVDVYNHESMLYGIQNALILGDFNADCSYVSSSDLDMIDLWTDSRFTWLINMNADTTTAASHCAYDRAVAAGPSMLTHTSIAPGSAKVYDFQTDFDLSQSVTDSVSDHYPIVVTIG